MQRAYALAAHRVALVRHRRRADLVLFKRLLDLLHVLQNADIVGEAVGALGDLRENAQHVIVEFARIRLPRHAVHGGITELGNDALFQLFDLFAVAVKQVQKACLRSRRPLHAAKLDRVFQIDEIIIIHFQIGQPESGALAHRDQLCGLQMGKPERGQILYLSANFFSLSITLTSFFITMSSALSMMITSALSVT